MSIDDRGMVTRRTLVRGFLSVGAATLLAACGAAAPQAGPGTTSASAVTSAAAPQAASGTSGDTIPAAAVAGAPGASSNLIKAKIGIVTGINSAEIYYGQAKGIFQANGVDPQPIVFQQTTAMRDALISGNIDLAAQAPFHVYLAQAQGVPLRLVGNRRTIVDVGLLIRNDLASTVSKVADLKGHTIAVNVIGAWDWGIIIQYLTKEGLKPTDVKFIGGASNPYGLLKAKQTDTAEANPPSMYQVLDDKVGELLVNLFDEATHLKYFGAKNVMSRAWLTHQRVIDGKPDLIAGIVTASNTIFDQIQSASLDDLVAVLQPSYADTSPPILQRSISDDLKKAIPRSSAMSKAAYQADQQIFLNAGILKKEIPFETAVEGKWAGVEA